VYECNRRKAQYRRVAGQSAFEVGLGKVKVFVGCADVENIKTKTNKFIKKIFFITKFTLISRENTEL
jgi:hypothetical protein